jgi:enamine deaminase RidA (YjgF/YER057c/UK114 family)
MGDYSLYNEYRNYFYQQQKLVPFPASVCVQAGLCRPELLVEIEAVAIIKNYLKKNKK